MFTPVHFQHTLDSKRGEQGRAEGRDGREGEGRRGLGRVG